MSIRSIARTMVLAVASALIISTRASIVMAQPSAKSAEKIDNGHAVPVPSVHAVRRASPITIDGKLDEAAWSAAETVTQFTQYDPNEGNAPTQQTAVRILYDDNALYIGATMFDTAGPAGITTRLVRRDNQFDSDYFQVVIDGYHDHLSRAFFTVNPSGSKQDQIGLGSSCCDSGWDPVWEVQTRINTDGWTAEIRIPLNQLRYSADSLQTWGLQLRRYIQRIHEEDDWSFWNKTEAGGPPRFGHLEGLKISHSPRHVELLPYISSTARSLEADKHDPFNYGVQPSARVGADIKYLLTSNLTLDATINPDFGQVEVDPAVVNLSAFETSFSEKRPFFIEGSGVFDFGSFNCFFCSNVSSLNAFYSRRIGRAPTGAGLAYSTGKYADVPDASAILGAVKITGRTSNGYTVGLLNAVTNRETAQLQFADGTKGSQEVEPLSNYFVGRVKKDFLRGNLTIGGIGTSVKRNLDSTFTPRLAGHAEFIGADVRYNFGNHRYTLIANSGLSAVSGDSNVMLARQTNSAHYFQRPDRGAGSDGFFSNRLDSSATSMIGAGGYARIAKDAGSWLWEAAVNVRTPGFENNDLAFNQRSDYIFYNANIFRNWQKPTKWYRNLNIIFGGQQQKNFEGDLTDRQLQVYAGTSTPQFWNVTTFYIWHPALLDDRLLRGGPIVTRPGTAYHELDFSTDSRKKIVLSSSANYSSNTRGGWGASVSEKINYRPSSNVSVSFGPSWSDGQSLLQYLTAIPDAKATNFFGTRYVLSGLRQKTLAFDTRLNITFSPRMTLELYAQPFFASGHYSKFKEFGAPRQANYNIFGEDVGTVSTMLDTLGKISKYTIDPDGAGPAGAFSFSNPDFTQRSLRGNAVFRWEYRPGSVFYLAWTHSRFSQDSEGNLDFSRERTALEASHPNNIFLVKASWWI
ncbi:MAG: DUF5916 domain-containing protein, partial [Gemmatimonadaceae bacterium]